MGEYRNVLKVLCRMCNLKVFGKKNLFVGVINETFVDENKKNTFEKLNYIRKNYVNQELTVRSTFLKVILIQLIKIAFKFNLFIKKNVQRKRKDVYGDMLNWSTVRG